MSQLARVFPKISSPHETRVVSLGRQNTSGTPFNIKARNCRIYPVQNSRVCDFGQKYMSQMARVFSKLASPHETRVVSLGMQNISGVPFNIKARSCRSYPVHKVEFVILGRNIRLKWRECS